MSKLGKCLDLSKPADDACVDFVSDANSRYPNAQLLHSQMLEISRRVVMKMSQVQSVGSIGKQHNAFVQHLLNTQSLAPEWNEFCSLVGGKFIDSLITGKFLMPSVLLPIVYKVADAMLVDLQFRQKCFELLEKIDPMNNSENMIQCFICSFVHDVGAEIIIFICESVIGEKPKKEKQLKQFTIEDRQSIFYVAGCAFHHYVKKRKRWKNKEWTAISEAVESRVREGNGVPLCAQSDRSWTEDKNRVNLFFIGAPAMEFMVQLAQCIYNVDSDIDGCFKDDDIIKDVFEDNVALLLWDELIGDALDNNLSIRLMKGVVKSFNSTYARGVVLQKLNEHLKKAFHSMSLRHSVAPRQEN